MPQIPRNIKKSAISQNTIVSNTVREGISFADVAKASNQSEIAIPITPGSIQQSSDLNPENLPPLQISNKPNALQPPTIPNT